LHCKVSPVIELRDALSQISEIRSQMAQTQTFRGYRAAPAAISSAIAIATALAQRWWVPEPARDLSSYLVLWIGAAAISVAVFATEMIFRLARHGLTLQRQMTLLAVEQFIPCLVAGAMLTAVVVRFGPQQAWMLCGLWPMLFSLGVFASRRLLPPAIFWVGVFYMLAGTANLALASDAAAFSPWSMGVAFGAGQALVAAILYWKLERRDGSQK
jgi:hypothetical protein